jgi:CubicO group peptidase (beta-lactamase class C family)
VRPRWNEFGVPLRRLLAAAALLLAAGAAAETPDRAALAARADEYLQAQVKVNDFSGAVLIARDGEVVLSRGYGLASRELGVPATPQTKFRLGSITKQFTAMAVMLLQEQGKLSVTDSVCKYVPECPETWAPVTLHHLLTHTSGLPNFTSFSDYRSKMALPSPPAETLARFRDKPLEFAPGERYAYSNSGYVLLGYIIEKVAGKSYHHFLRENILQPLGMRDTGYDFTEVVLENRAAGYRRASSSVLNAEYIDMTIPHAAGALYSTVEDLFLWDRALAAGKLISAASYEAMFTPARNNYAYGWIVQTLAGRKVIAHGGGINGFFSRIMRFPETNSCVIVLSNIEGAPVDRIRLDLMAILFDQPYELPRTRVAIPVDAKILERYAGRYELSPTFALTVTLEEGRLMMQATGQPKVELFAESETKFFLRAVDAQVSFEVDEQGRATGLILHQAGRDQRARRVKE